MQNKDILKLMEQGIELLEKSEFDKAVKHFQKILGLDPKSDPFARNNLGLALLHKGDLEHALEAIKPNIDEAAPANPFGHALAAQIYTKQGDKKQAVSELDQAVKDFEQGLSSYRNKSDIPKYWKEYLMTIFETAGDLEDHRLVYNTYRNWQNIVDNWEIRFMAGVAAFNLGRFRQAAGIWSSIHENENISIQMQRVALMADRGVVPPFQIPYQLDEQKNIENLHDNDNAMDEKAVFTSLVANSEIRMTMLAFLFDADQSAEVVSKATMALILYGEDWGLELGKELLEDATVSLDVKYAAAKALVELGLYQYNENIPVKVDGKIQYLRISEIEMVDENTKELAEALEKAKKLSNQGKVEEAVGLLNNAVSKGKASPDVLFYLSQLHFQLSDYEHSLQTLEAIDNAYPNHPVVLFSKALSYQAMGMDEEALEELNKIDTKHVHADFKEQIKTLELILKKDNLEEFAESFFSEQDYVMEQYEEKKRKEIEAKTLPVDAGLARCMKNMPAIWLEGACEYFELPNYRKRKDREKALAEFLLDTNNLKAIIKDLEQEEKELLKYLLDKGGWSTIGPITKKFSSTDGDGYFWNEELPGSELGFLWSLCLVFVGKASINGKNTKIAAIPLELREELKRLDF